MTGHGRDYAEDSHTTEAGIRPSFKNYIFIIDNYYFSGY
jgi:hypothetical protein